MFQREEDKVYAPSGLFCVNFIGSWSVEHYYLCWELSYEIDALKEERQKVGLDVHIKLEKEDDIGVLCFGGSFDHTNQILQHGDIAHEMVWPTSCWPTHRAG